MIRQIGMIVLPPAVLAAVIAIAYARGRIDERRKQERFWWK